MQVTQNYARASSATMADDGLKLNVSTELSRPPVALQAIVKDSLAYARVMLALYDVVSGDYRAKPKDHSAYQAWLEERYLEEMSEQMGEQLKRLPALARRRDELKARLNELRKTARPLEQALSSADFYRARGQYYRWLAKNNWAAWLVLDPVVSVHPYGVIFEVFSIDESSYGRVTVPTEKLDTFGETIYGTTNIDYSKRLADEIRRVRGYRPAWLQVGGEGVTIATSAGEAVEKKIDLPPSWVRGFLQVQSAAAFPGIELKLSAATMADVLSALHSRREKEGPRSLRFVLAPGEKPKIIIEPWNVEVREATHVFQGEYSGDIRIWGRRRLFAIESLLPHAESIGVKLLGTGMPSYWTVFQKDHRFDLGLSGWTQNDWSRSARFDLLASTADVSDGDIELAASQLSQALRLMPEELSMRSDLTREAAATALQRLCREGRAMYDLAQNVYRWRQLLPFPVPPPTDEDQRLSYAKRLVSLGAVKWLKIEDEENAFGGARSEENMTRLNAQVRSVSDKGETKRERKFEVALELDADGRVRFANCTCSWHRREKLRKGPCAHILAASALASQQSVAAKAAATSSDSSVLSPDRFKGQTFVFTGALSLFTREQAEALVEQAGGKASGSVSKNTSYLVAGEKAGSKLTKAQQLKVPVLSEAEFKAMLEGKASTHK